MNLIDGSDVKNGYSLLSLLRASKSRVVSGSSGSVIRLSGSGRYSEH
jgi:hypothetical protein